MNLQGKWSAGARRDIGRTVGQEYVQPTMPAAEPAHAFGLDAGHAEEVLGVGEVGGELAELRLQLGLCG